MGKGKSKCPLYVKINTPEPLHRPSMAFFYFEGKTHFSITVNFVSNHPTCHTRLTRVALSCMT